MLNKGLFIVFEGGEGGGKTTQIRLLKYYLEKRGYNVVLTREPGGVNCAVAEKVREILMNPEFKSMCSRTELLLFLAGRAQHVEELIKPSLEEGVIVLCDRFDGSTFAYQHYARGLDLEQIKELNNWAKNNIEPNLVIFLDIDPEDGIRRRGKDLSRIDNETIEFHRKVRAGYEALCQQNKNWIKIDGRGEVDSVHEEIVKAIEQLLPAQMKF